MTIDLDVDDICTELAKKSLIDDEVRDILRALDTGFFITEVIYKYAYNEFVDNGKKLPEMPKEQADE